MRKHYLSVAFMLSAVPAQLAAGIAYNNFGPGNTYGNLAATTGLTYLATTFTATGGGPLASVLLPIDSSTTPVSFGLYTDSGGAPGMLLESWSVPVTTSAQIVTLTSVAHPVLSSGAQYWFVMHSSGGTIQWVYNNQGVNGGWYAGNGLNGLGVFFASGPTLAIELVTQDAPTGTPVPPTLILTLTGLSLGGFGALWTRRRTGRIMA